MDETLQQAALFEAVWNSADVGMCVTNAERRFVEVNQAYCALYGYSRDELIGCEFTKVLPEAERAYAARIHDAFIAGAEESAGEWRVQRKDGTILEVHVTAARVMQHGQVYKVTTVKDISAAKVASQELERQVAERTAALAASEARYRSIIENFPNGAILQFDLNLRYTLVEGLEWQHLGIDPDSFVGKTIHELFSGATLARLEALYRRSLAGESFACDLDFAAEMYDARFVPLTDPQGNIYGGMMITQRITERNNIARELETWKARYDLIVASSGQIAYEYDIASSDIAWSGSVKNVLGFAVSAMDGGITRWLELIHLEDREMTLAKLEEAEAQAAPYHISYRFQNARGDYTWLEDRGFFLTDDQGRAVTMLGMMRDINQQRHAEAELKLFRKLVESATDAIALVSSQGALSYVNPAYERMLGYSAEELLGSSPLRVLSAAGQQSIQEAIAAIFAQGRWQGSIEFQHRDGSRIASFMTSFALYDSQGSILRTASIIKDMRQQQRAERALAASEQRLRLLVSSLPVVVFTTDAHGVFTLSEGKALADIGLQPGQVVGFSLFELYSSMPDVVEKARRALAGESCVFDVYVAGAEQYFEQYFAALRSPQGNIDGILGVAYNITERKRAEQHIQRSNDRLARQNALNSSLNNATNAHSILDSVAAYLGEYFTEHSSMSLFYVDTDAQEQPSQLRLIADKRASPELAALAAGSSFEIDSFPSATLWLDNPHEPSFFMDIAQDTNLDAQAKAIFASLGLQSIVAIPLLNQKRWVGLLTLHWHAPMALDDALEEYCSNLPLQLAPVIEVVRLIAELEHTLADRSRDLQESQELLRLVVDNLPAIIVWKDLGLRFLGVNKAFATIAGYDNPEDMVGKTDFDTTFSREQAEAYRRDDQEIIASGQARLGYEETSRDSEGNINWIRVSKLPLRDKSGNIIGIASIGEDITEQKRARESLQAYREQLARAETELNITKRIQALLIPSSQELQAIYRLDIAGVMLPAEKVGGDYYDILHYDQGVTIGIGDVTGHGLESGLLMLMTQTAIRTLIASGESEPTRFFEVLNTTLYDNLQRMQADKSLSLARLDYQHSSSGGALRLSGQHEHLLIVRQGGHVEVIDTLMLGMPLGLEPSIASYIAEHHFRLQPGDGVVLYTDGITEAENSSGEQYGLERLCACIHQHWQHPAEVLCQQIINEVERHIAGHTVYDDMSLLVLKQQ